MKARILSRVEEWRPIVIDGEPWPYAVSDCGQVMRLIGGTGLCRAGRLLRPRLNRFGYPQVQLRNGRGASRTLHRLVTAAFLGPRPEGLVVNHIDGVKTNNAVTNLEYVTSSENHQHAVRIGLKKRDPFAGVRYVAQPHVLTATQVVAIRRRYAGGGISQEALAAAFGVCQTTISDVVCGRRYTHVNGPE